MGFSRQGICQLEIIAQGDGGVVRFPGEETVVVAAAVTDPVSMPVKDQPGNDDKGGIITGFRLRYGGFRRTEGTGMDLGQIGQENELHFSSDAFGQGNLLSICKGLL